MHTHPSLGTPSQCLHRAELRAILPTHTCSAPSSVLVGLAMETHSVKAVSAAALSLPPDGSEVKKWGIEGGWKKGHLGNGLTRPGLTMASP